MKERTCAKISVGNVSTRIVYPAKKMKECVAYVVHALCALRICLSAAFACLCIHCAFAACVLHVACFV